MYVEVFKHEFMHRLETKALYSKFFNYCFKKSKAFEQYVRAELKSAGVNFNVELATFLSVISRKNMTSLNSFGALKTTLHPSWKESANGYFGFLLGRPVCLEWLISGI